jgi:hypothetical protein
VKHFHSTGLSVILLAPHTADIAHPRPNHPAALQAAGCLTKITPLYLLLHRPWKSCPLHSNWQKPVFFEKKAFSKSNLPSILLLKVEVLPDALLSRYPLKLRDGFFF